MSTKRNDLPEWHALQDEAKNIKDASIRDLFNTEQERLKHFSCAIDGLFFDASKSLARQKTLDLLIAFARAIDLESQRDEMFSGTKINNSENRAVLHTALRRPASNEITVDDTDVIPGIHYVLGQMKDFSEKIRSEKKIKHIVNIGIGGSDLGPRTVYTALKDQFDGPEVHFVANVDGADVESIITKLDPSETLFIVASKSFTTQETLMNAETAKSWLVNKLGPSAVEDHFVALSTNKGSVEAFGIDPNNMFPFENWVGGRFSVWSAIGLSLCLGLGYKAFEELLAGAYEIDQHFQKAPLEENIPVLMGLLGFWYRSFLDMPAYACLPYDQRLDHLPLWLQQLDMESNGKSVSRQGLPIDYNTGPIVFGQPGTNGQHAFYQHIHQSATITPCEFIGFKEAQHPYNEHHRTLLANMVAQAQALMDGKEAGADEPYRSFSGNRPSTTLLFDKLTPKTLGMLLALYEHKIFIQGVLWDINSFDQWGVELGKSLAQKILLGDTANSDSSTHLMLKKCGL